MPSRADWASSYIRRWGFVLVPVLPGSKAPRFRRWNAPNRTLRSALSARRYWQRHPNDNMGVLLGPSRLVSIDIDESSLAQEALKAIGVSLEPLEALTLQGQAPKVRHLFRAPPGVPLGRRALRWPALEGARPITLLELRAGQVQDLLPPSVHPRTRAPYRWLVAPWQLEEIPTLPKRLLELWLGWEDLYPELEAACPWIRDRKAPTTLPEYPGAHEDWDALRDYLKQQLPLEPLLEALGAEKRGGGYLCPFHHEAHPSFWTFKTAEGYPLWVDAHGGAPVGRSAAQGYSVGDVIDLYQALRGLPSPGKATAELAKALGLKPCSQPTTPHYDAYVGEP